LAENSLTKNQVPHGQSLEQTADDACVLFKILSAVCLGLTNSESALALSLAHRLGAGERSCLAVAMYRGGMLATDDRVARQHAQKARVAVTGTLGILVQNVKTGRLLVHEAQSLLDTLRAAGYRSPIQSLDEIFNKQ
jgi:predicted nucleic acid-binding protein